MIRPAELLTGLDVSLTTLQNKEPKPCCFACYVRVSSILPVSMQLVVGPWCVRGGVWLFVLLLLLLQRERQQGFFLGMQQRGQGAKPVWRRRIRNETSPHANWRIYFLNTVMDLSLVCFDVYFNNIGHFLLLLLLFYLLECCDLCSCKALFLHLLVTKARLGSPNKKNKNKTKH